MRHRKPTEGKKVHTCNNKKCPFPDEGEYTNCNGVGNLSTLAKGQRVVSIEGNMTDGFSSRYQCGTVRKVRRKLTGKVSAYEVHWNGTELDETERYDTPDALKKLGKVWPCHRRPVYYSSKKSFKVGHNIQDSNGMQGEVTKIHKKDYRYSVRWKIYGDERLGDPLGPIQTIHPRYLTNAL